MKIHKFVLTKTQSCIIVQQGRMSYKLRHSGIELLNFFKKNGDIKPHWLDRIRFVDFIRRDNNVYSKVPE